MNYDTAVIIMSLWPYDLWFTLKGELHVSVCLSCSTMLQWIQSENTETCSCQLEDQFLCFLL